MSTTYNLIEIALLCQIMEDITGCDRDYPLVPMILEDIKKEGLECNIEASVKHHVTQYLCMCNNCTSYQDYLSMEIDYMIYGMPLSSMPLYLNCEGKEILKRVVATWRITLGRY